MYFFPGIIIFFWEEEDKEEKMEHGSNVNFSTEEGLGENVDEIFQNVLQCLVHINIVENA